TFIIRRKNAGEPRSGISFCAIYNITWRQVEKSFLDSTRPTTAATTRLKYAIFFKAVAQTSSANGFFSKTDCPSDVLGTPRCGVRSAQRADPTKFPYEDRHRFIGSVRFENEESDPQASSA